MSREWFFQAMLYLFLVCPAPALGEEGQPAEKAEPRIEDKKPSEEGCKVRMNFGELAFQDVKITDDKVKGPDFSLLHDGNVWYGFVLSKPTRFKVGEDHISGSIAEMDLMLHIEKKPTRTKVFGLVGIRRVVVEVSANRIKVYASGSTKVVSSASMLLKRTRGNRLHGHVAVGGDIASADLVTFGCDLDHIRESPGLIVILFMWWLGA